MVFHVSHFNSASNDDITEHISILVQADTTWTGGVFPLIIVLYLLEVCLVHPSVCPDLDAKFRSGVWWTVCCSFHICPELSVRHLLNLQLLLAGKHAEEQLDFSQLSLCMLALSHSP